MRYERAKQRLQIQFLGPLFESQGRLEVDHKVWKWVGGTSTAPESIDEILKGAWTEKVDFLFGIVTQKNGIRVQRDSRGLPVQAHFDSQKLECKYEGLMNFPAQCEIEAENSYLKVLFTSVKCQDSL